MGLDVIPVNDEPDGFFSRRNPEPKEDTLQGTVEFLKQHNADLAICFDGDADRVVFCDKEGFLGFNESIAFISRLVVKKTGKKKIATTVEAGTLLDLAVKDLGAEVLVTGVTYDQATEEAITIQHARGLTMIHPFDDPLVIAGQGTIGLEILEEEPDIDTVIVPLSGGGLLGGIALTLKSINPKITTIGVSMDQGAAMIESLQAGHVVEIIEHASLADALIGGLGWENRYSFKINQNFVDRTVKVSEQEIAMGMTYALEKENTVVEGGGAVVLAAILAGKVTELGKKAALVISGSNVNLSTLLACIQKLYPYQKLALE